MTHHSNVLALSREAPGPLPPLASGDQVRHACQEELEAHGLTITQAAREMGRGVSQATLSRWLRGNYDGDSDAVAGRVRRWIETRRERAAQALGGAGLDRHALLGVTEEIEQVLAYAQAAGDVVIVHGRSGAGKSHAVGHYCGAHTAAYHLMVTGAVTTLAGMLARVAAAVGAGEGHGSSLAAETEIVARLRDRSALLCVDEAHFLRPRLIDELRCIRDITGCGLALVGDDTLWTGIVASARLAQVVGRTGIRLPVGAPSEPDIAQIAERGLEREPSAREFKLLAATARGAGGLHALRRLLVRSRIVARGAGNATPSAADLQAAVEEGGAL